MGGWSPEGTVNRGKQERRSGLGIGRRRQGGWGVDRLVWIGKEMGMKRQGWVWWFGDEENAWG